MKTLFQAIMGRFAGSALSTALGGRLYNSVAAQTATPPFGVFMLVAGTPDWTFTEAQEDVLIQFSLFDSNASVGPICDAYELLTALFDDCKLSVTGWTHLYMHRQSQQLVREEEDPGCWHYIIEYRTFMEKSR
ncbi:MAG TPA: hypothetical protein PKV86_07090 [Syntrophobacteraceae bacterium]|nr:hypothetical protein [Syntrophobacteraceae bacterium]